MDARAFVRRPVRGSRALLSGPLRRRRDLLEVPAPVIARLPLYHRVLSDLEQDGQAFISSQELGEALGLTPAQIRADLSYFGRFGTQGAGYFVPRLAQALRRILGLDRRWTLVLVGSGRLGRAIASYGGFRPQGFDLEAVYDSDPGVIGTDVAGYTVRDAALLAHDLCATPADLGIVAVPADQAQRVVDTLVEAGVGAILNYAPRAVRVPRGVHLRRVDPVGELQSMTYHLSHHAAARAVPATSPPGLREILDLGPIS